MEIARKGEIAICGNAGECRGNAGQTEVILMQPYLIVTPARFPSVRSVSPGLSWEGSLRVMEASN
jgi:hypothetical protein